MQIAFDQVSHIYGKGTPFEKRALSDISLTIPSGAYVGIIGQTGSGKSTLIQHLNGLLLPTSGSIRVGDWEITPGTKLTPAFRRHIGIVFQYPEHQLFEETIAKDVAYGPMQFGVPAAETEQRVEQALATVGLSYAEMKDRSPFRLSGGQMRRVAIAGVLAMEPSVLVLDEPTAGLDPAGRQAILEAIYDIHKERRLTTIMVTHSMEEAARYADWLIVMAGGQIALQGTPQDVFADSDRLHELSLDVPETVSFIRQLNNRLPQDKQIPLSLYREEELTDYLVRLLRPEKGGGD
ncbi:energy-coupling factor transporter ATPase [Brevibacillus fluminis]|uniref:Energy-coupling factor transporter ATP-binding protein EcfA2 n=1 Tax=Brevibacillus fluminis TaxID=511487 RepID=A0A3M8CT90_9BACL|nr:energy-coupling factor transporter ATPase [Brevibacillus fluminis]RNB79012.1 energy-coupling factor transporter ATPase [Brevibacillus fluminis]